MFAEIQNEVMKILNNDPMERIAYRPTIDVAKILAIVYRIKLEDIERQYTYETIGIGTGDVGLIYIIHHCDDNKYDKFYDTIFKGGKAYALILINSKLITELVPPQELCDTLNFIIRKRTKLILDVYLFTAIVSDTHDTLDIFDLARPVILSAVARNLYRGDKLSEVIYNSLISDGDKDISKDMVNSILKLLNEGISVQDLLDNSYIRGAEPENYPGLFVRKEKKDIKCFLE